MNAEVFKRSFFLVLCFIFLCICSLSPDGNRAAAASDRRMSVPVNPVEKPLYPGRQHLFDGVGRVDRVSAKEVVIDDRAFRFAKKARFNIPGRHDVSRAWVREGSVVGFILNPHREIDSLWIME